MAIADDFTIDYVNKRVYHETAGTEVFSVNALYSYLMDTFDEPEQMDDTVPMSAQTPTDYTIINSWFIDDESIKFLKGGAIKTDANTNVIRILSFGATYTNAITTDIGKTVLGGTTTDTAKLLAFDNTTKKWWIRMVDSGDLFDQAEAITITTGTGAGTTTGVSVSGEDLYPNVYTLGSIEEDDSQQIYIIQNGTSLTEWWPDAGAAPATRHIDVLIKTKEAGTEIDDGKVTVFLRHYPSGGNADLFDHFDIDLTGGGRNAVPLATSPDLNNTSTHALVATYNSVTIAFVNGTITHGAITNGPFVNFEEVTGANSLATAVVLLDSAGTMTLGNISGTFESGEVITGDGGASATTSSTVTVVNTMSKAFIKDSDRDYSVIVDCAGRRLSEVYEYMKYVLREDSAFQTYGVKSTSGTLSLNIMDGEQYIRAYTDVTTAANSYSPVKASPFGTFAGGKFFGARGVWLENMDSADILAYQLIDSTNVNRTPPNQQTITISNLLAQDRVAVFRTTSGTTIQKDRYTAASGNDLGNATFVTTEAIDNDTPTTGTLRIIDTSDTSSDREVRYAYTSWSGSTFSGLTPTLDRNYTQTDDTAYVPYIDTVATDTSASATVIYVADRSILIRVRRYQTTAILPFETTATFSSTGYSTNAIRTPDSIVS